MEELIILGTGNANVTECYNTCFALRSGKEYFLVDTGGGNGILRRLKQSHIEIEQIHHIFITHEHSDHLLGIVWMIRMIGTKMNQGSYPGKLYIYCHEELISTIRTIVSLTVQKKCYKYFDDRMIFVPVNDGEQHKIIDTDVTFFDIYSTKARQYGFTLMTKSNQKLTCLGDEPYNEKTYDYVKGSDWLLSEAFCLYEDRKKFKPYEKHHSTVKEACELASKLNVKNLILWHTEDSDILNRKERYTKEGKQYFENQLYVPDDLEVIPL